MPPTGFAAGGRRRLGPQDFGRRLLRVGSGERAQRGSQTDAGGDRDEGHDRQQAGDPAPPAARSGGGRGRPAAAAAQPPRPRGRARHTRGRERRRAQLARRRVPVRRPLRERPRHHGLERKRHARRDGAQRRRRLVQVRARLRHPRPIPERRRAGQRGEQHAAERVDVGAGIELVAVDLLGRGVVGRAHPLAGGGQRGRRAVAAREPEVGEVHVRPVRQRPRHEQVRRLHVAVHEAARVRGVERRAACATSSAASAGSSLPRGGDHPAEVGAVHEAHRDEQPVAVLAGLVHRDHVRVVERRRDPRLAREPRPEGVVAREVRRDQLERDRAIEGDLSRPVYDAHAAAPGHCLDPVPGDARAEHR